MEPNDSENSLAKETKKKRMKKKKKKNIENLEENVCDEQPEYIPLPSTVPVAKTIGKGPDADEADIQAGEEAAEEAAAQECSAASRRPYWMSNCSSIKSPLLRLHQGQLLHTVLVSTASFPDPVNCAAACIIYIFILLYTRISSF